MKEINMEGVPNTEVSPTLQLKCNPSCLPPAPYTAPTIPSLGKLPREVTDYYRRIRERRKAAYFNRKGAK